MSFMTGLHGYFSSSDVLEVQVLDTETYANYGETLSIGFTAYQSAIIEGEVLINGSHSYDWLISGKPENVDIRATLVAQNGPVSGDSTGVWLNLGTARSWSCSDNTILDIELRNAASGAVLDEGQVVFGFTSS